ncbi:MAG: M20 family metallopeptidase [Myxococcales bacterium]|nr:M20 family metallopeptidase [Myxococcales bacterium]
MNSTDRSTRASALDLRIDQAIDAMKDRLAELALKIHSHPELRFEEHRAAAWISETAGSLAGVSVERPFGGLETALRARVNADATGARVAILAEYDALPHVGHACGHNLIAAGAVGAFCALAQIARENPAVFDGAGFDLVGTPAEEGGGGKITLIDAGAFRGVDCAMMFHPFDRDLLAHPTLANVWLQFEFRGKASHAAIAPWDGESALSAVTNTFHLIDSQRVHFRDGVRVHGYVTNGGEAVNIIAAKASCEFSVRATNVRELERVRAIVERCAKAAAMAGDVTLEISARRGYKDLSNNMPLADTFGAHMKALGRAPKRTDPNAGAGSTDMGDVSHAVPSIHPWVAICDENETTCHQHAFAKCAASPRGIDAMIVAAKAMARTAADFVRDESLRKRAREAFEESEGAAS